MIDLDADVNALQHQAKRTHRAQARYDFKRRHPDDGMYCSSCFTLLTPLDLLDLVCQPCHIGQCDLPDDYLDD